MTTVPTTPPSSTLHTSSIASLHLLARGKVRDNYAVGTDRLLMVASDRVSAFDVILGEPIPGKGALLTQMALFWFGRLGPICPNHLTGEAPESAVTAAEAPQVAGRSMLVKRLKPIPVEAVVRGYLAGSGWLEYQQNQSVCGVPLPAGLKNASLLPEPIFTPAAKAAVGEHDENISYEQVVKVVGPELAAKIKKISIEIYQAAAAFALTKRILNDAGGGQGDVASRRGTVTRKVAPPPGVGVTSTAPACAWAIAATIERPSPVPPSARARDSSAR